MFKRTKHTAALRLTFRYSSTRNIALNDFGLPLLPIGRRAPPVAPMPETEGGAGDEPLAATRTRRWQVDQPMLASPLGASSDAALSRLNDN